MKKIASQSIKLILATFLFIFSVYGVYFKEKIPSKANTVAMEKKFSKSNFFLNKENPVISFIGDLEINNNVISHVKQLCDYTKIPFSYIPIKKHMLSEDFYIPNSLKIIFLNKTDSLPQKIIEKLVCFTAKGGTIIVMNTPTDQRLNYLIGLSEKKSLHKYNTSAKGILFNNNFTPNLNNIAIFKDIIHYGLNKSSFNENVKTILASINEKNYPVILENKIGLGKVILFNTTFEISKYERGLIFPCILSSLEGVPYPIANINTIFLDDFPSPVYPFIKEPILSEYNVSNQKFVKDIWWPDMLKLAKKYNIKYTTTIIFDYDENVEPPFSYKQWNLAKENFIPISHKITQDVLRENHELGIHGYNHVSLLKKSWSPENIIIAMNTVKKMWDISDYGHYPISYIPPSNYIDKQGVLALHAGLPSLKYMCSLYTGKLKKGGDREFNPEPYTHEMFDFPRNTSGFYLNSFKKYLKESMFLYTGIWSHFVHPDDIYQIPVMGNLKTRGEFSFRNKLGLNWKKTNNQNQPGMLPTFEKLIKEHYKNYPLTKFPDVKNGGKLVADLRADHFKHNSIDQFYSVQNLSSAEKEHNWFVYISKNESDNFFQYLKNNNYLFSKTTLFDGFIVNIKTSNGKISIPKYHKENNDFDKAYYLSEYHNHLNYKETSKGLLRKKIESLRKKIFQQTKLSIDTWKEYAKYSSWTKNENIFWNDLENYYYKHQNYESSSLSEAMAKIIWYPSEKIKINWLERKIITADSLQSKIKLLKEYIKNNNTGKNIESIQKKLKLIAELNPSIENRIAFISSYLWNESGDKLAVLLKIPLNTEYKYFANELAWYFYDRGYLLKALEWASISNKITIDMQMNWLFEAKKHEQLNSFYLTHKYKSENEKLVADKTMIDFYLARDMFMEAWKIAIKIPNSHHEYKSIQKKMNVFYLYQNRNIHKELINDDSFLYEKTKDSIHRIIMLEENNLYNFESFLSTNRTDINNFDKKMTYSCVNKKKKAHNFSFTQSSVNDIMNNKEKNISLYGFNYKFESSRLFNQQFQYSGSFGFETDRNKYFYNFNTQISYNVENNFLSAEYTATPVKNNVGLENYMYANTLNLYYEKNFENKVNASSFLEGNYYTDDNYDTTISLSVNYPVINYGGNTFRTVLESSHSFGSTNSEGIPYWMTINRHFAGGGMQYQLNSDIDKTFILIDGMYFYDSYSSYFSRYRAKINFHLQKYFTVNFNGELYNHDLYYSNTLNIGLSYYMH